MTKPTVTLTKAQELAIVNNDVDRWSDIARKFGITPARVSYLKSIHRWEDQRRREAGR